MSATALCVLHGHRHEHCSDLVETDKHGRQPAARASGGALGRGSDRWGRARGAGVHPLVRQGNPTPNPPLTIPCPFSKGDYIEGLTG